MPHWLHDREDEYDISVKMSRPDSKGYRTVTGPHIALIGKRIRWPKGKPIRKWERVIWVRSTTTGDRVVVL